MNELLLELNACNEAVKWAKDKDWKEIYTTCHRGDWLLWLFQKTNPDDLQLLTLAKAKVVNQIRHLIKDERSIKALDVALAFGEGNASRDELDVAAADAYAAAAYAADADAYAAADAAYAAAAAYAADAAAYAAAAARTYRTTKAESLKSSANIVREVIPIEKWNIERKK